MQDFSSYSPAVTVVYWSTKAHHASAEGEGTSHQDKGYSETSLSDTMQSATCLTENISI